MKLNDYLNRELSEDTLLEIQENVSESEFNKLKAIMDQKIDDGDLLTSQEIHDDGCFYIQTLCSTSGHGPQWNYAQDMIQKMIDFENYYSDQTYYFDCNSSVDDSPLFLEDILY